MLRNTSNTGAFSQLPEKMSKKHIREIAKKYDVDISGLTFNIDMNEELLLYPIAGEAVPERIGKITFFPNAFKSEEELLRTLYHESIHVKQYRKYGAKYVQDNMLDFENEAYALEEEFITKLKKEGKL